MWFGKLSLGIVLPQFIELSRVRIDEMLRYVLGLFGGIVSVTVPIRSRHKPNVGSGASLVYNFDNDVCVIVTFLIVVGFLVRMMLFFTGPLLLV